MSTREEELVSLQLHEPERTFAKASIKTAGNGAPAGEPEVWNAGVAVYTPLQGHAPEPAPAQVSPAFAAGFEVEEYLAEERTKDLLRFSTAGSVDDGKSTLIGRLLYDTQSVYDDQIRAIEGKGTTAPGVLDLALLTDGLRAEREQGITIDVAYRYFSTTKRKFIIADTPGHEQYTRNMATGASTADAATVLVDARKGVLVQSRRHAYITALLGVRHVIIAVNKMDTVGFAESIFAQTKREFTAFFNSITTDGSERTTLYFVPVSALEGDNVVRPSAAMPWYNGPTLLQLLETVPSSSKLMAELPFRLAVQRVIRPNPDFRGFAGQIASGIVRVGDRITTAASGKSSSVRRIVTFDGDLQEAVAPMSMTLVLGDEIDISRGDLLFSGEPPPAIANDFTASLVWMDEAPLALNRRYLLKHGSRTVQAEVSKVLRIIDLTSLAESSAPETLMTNGIGDVHIKVRQPIALDTYASNRHIGSFVLIDLESNATVAAGMILKPQPAKAMEKAQAPERSIVTLKGGNILHLEGTAATITRAVKALRDAGTLADEGIAKEIDV